MRRYSILFIDDEEVIRESFLKLVDWEKRGYDVVDVYKNGEMAWEYLKQNSVDIIVTDINMPFMDGIDLLEQIRQMQMKTRVLLLTGYEYFEYAQKAVQLKAFDFLLKPVTKERLFRAVESAAFDIEKEEEAQIAVGKSLELSQSYFINQLLYGKLEKEKIRSEARNLKIFAELGNYLVVIVAVDAKKGYQIADEETGELKQSLQEGIIQLKGRMEYENGRTFELYFARNIGIQIQMILISRGRDAFDDCFVEEWARRLLSLQEMSDVYQLTVAYGKCRRYLEEIPETFKRVESALKNRHLSGFGRSIYVKDSILERKVAEKTILPTDTFLYHIRMGMTEEVENDIRGIYDTFRHKEYLSLESARMVTTELAITAFKGETTSKDTSVSYLFYLNLIQQLNTLDEMEREITEFAVTITKKRKQSGNHKKTIAGRALEYLNDNYERESLSLNDVAAALNISVPYLAVLFKKETDANFGAHLLRIRMEKAKELLRTSGDTIAEISEKVGYSSSQYFAVCFKKYTGMSPGVYRGQGEL